MTAFPPFFPPLTPVFRDPSWTNYHGTVAGKSVPCFAVLDGRADTTAAQTPPMRRQAEALQGILDLCFHATPPEPVRALGAKWSLSNIIEPTNVIIDTGMMNAMHPIDRSLFTAAYPSHKTPAGAVPVLVGGGASVVDINDWLGTHRLALPTSGASDGHRIAGCIATGTHGSAIGIGAVHDTVLAIYLVVAPDKGVLVQPATGTPFTPDLAAWFQAQTGIPSQNVSDDDVFCAALVSLGSLGIVHSVVLESVPLYRLEGRMRPRPFRDGAVLEAIRTFNTQPLHPDRADRPYHFSVLVNPYSGSSPGFFVGLYWKTSADGVAFAGPTASVPMSSSDTTKLLGSLIGLFDGPIAGPVVEHIITSTLISQNPQQDFLPAFPGQVFGPTTLPAGHGESTEIVVDQALALPALLKVLDAVEAERKNGHHLLGGIGVRFVPKTRALLGMNIHDMNCYMELGSIRTPAVQIIHQACWRSLDEAKIPYTCHWGQQHQLTAGHIAGYFGDRVGRWRAARAKLLPTLEARAVFGAKALVSVGLDK